MEGGGAGGGDVRKRRMGHVGYCHLGQYGRQFGLRAL